MIKLTPEIRRKKKKGELRKLSRNLLIFLRTFLSLKNEYMYGWSTKQFYGQKNQSKDTYNTINHMISPKCTANPYHSLHAY